MTSSFEVRRGTFTVPAELLDDAREHELARYFAERLPPRCTTIKRHPNRDGSLSIAWTKVRTRAWFDENGEPTRPDR